MTASEWESYKISGKYAELTAVKHIVHLPVARRIIEDGKIKSGQGVLDRHSHEGVDGDVALGRRNPSA